MFPGAKHRPCTHLLYAAKHVIVGKNSLYDKHMKALILKGVRIDKVIDY